MHLTGKSEDYVDRVYTQCRYVCAFAQWKRSHGMEFPAGVVEVDGMKTQLKRNMFDKRTATAAAKAACKAKATKRPAARVFGKRSKQRHEGRFLLSASRGSREHFVLPMEDQVTKKGAPPAPEKVAEALPLMKARVSPSKHVMASDSGQGLKQTWRALGLQQALAKHGQREFTPVVSLPKKHVPASMLKKMWKDSVKVSARKVKLVGGDQTCENMASKLKEQLRRTNKLGRSGATKGGATRDGMSAWWLKENPGLKSVAQCFATYRVAVQDKIPPGEAFSNLERDVLL